MGKARSALKFKGKETEVQLPAYRIGGNLIRGYTVLNRSDRELGRYEYVRDAVAHRDRLLSGEETEPEPSSDAKPEFEPGDDAWPL